MKKKVIRLVPLSLLLGVAITLLSTATMGWRAQDNCLQAAAPGVLKIQRVGCAGLEYGYPLRFISAESQLYFNATGEVAQPAMVGVSSQIRLNRARAADNIIIWSIISGFALYLFHPTTVLKTDPKKPTKKSSAKKKK